jgi:hypothetical protein
MPASLHPSTEKHLLVISCLFHNSHYNKCERQVTTRVGDNMRTGHPCTVLVRIWTGAVILENSMKVLKKTSDRTTPYDSPSHFWVHPKEMKSVSWRDNCTPMFIAAVFTIAKILSQFICPATDEWIHTHICIYTYFIRLLFGFKKGNLSICDNIILSEINQTEKRQISFFIFYLFYLFLIHYTLIICGDFIVIIPYKNTVYLNQVRSFHYIPIPPSSSFPLFQTVFGRFHGSVFKCI